MISAPHAVYRFYDRHDRLLYVGVTSCLGTRWNQHARRDWWKDVARYSLSWHDERAAAEAEEFKAIQTEHPQHNVTHTVFGWGTLTDEQLRALPGWEPRPKGPGPRRKRGEGGLFLRSDGYWVATLLLGYSSTGTRRVRTFSSKDRDTALARMEGYRASLGGVA